MTEEMKPNYKQLYTDMLNWKYPEKKEICSEVLKKKQLEALDVIMLNKMIFGHKESNQKRKSYDKSSVIEILSYQKNNPCTNKELSYIFKISRNTIARWKRIYT